MSNFNSPYPKTLRAEAVRLVKEGISRKEVSARLGIPLSTLKSWFPKKRAMIGHKARENRDEAIRCILAEGQRPAEVARQLDLSPRTLQRWLSEERSVMEQSIPKLQRQMTELHERIAMLEEQNLELRFQLKLVSSRRRGP